MIVVGGSSDRTPRALIAEMCRYQQVIDYPCRLPVIFDERTGWTVESLRAYCEQRLISLRKLLRTGSDGIDGEVAR